MGIGGERNSFKERMIQFAVRIADSKYKRVGERLKKKASGSGERNTKTEISQKKR